MFVLDVLCACLIIDDQGASVEMIVDKSLNLKPLTLNSKPYVARPTFVRFGSAVPLVKVLRIFRAFRIVRVFKRLKALRIIIAGCRSVCLPVLGR